LTIFHFGRSFDFDPEGIGHHRCGQTFMLQFCAAFCSAVYPIHGILVAAIEHFERCGEVKS
jgi:hypothetical protein